jgi:hypothetical protein
MAFDKTFGVAPRLVLCVVRQAQSRSPLCDPGSERGCVSCITAPPNCMASWCRFSGYQPISQTSGGGGAFRRRLLDLVGTPAAARGPRLAGGLAVSGDHQRPTGSPFGANRWHCGDLS